MWFLCPVGDVVDSNSVPLLPQLIQGCVVDFEPFVTIRQLDGIDFDVFGGGFCQFLRLDGRYPEPALAGFRMAKFDNKSRLNDRAEDAFLAGIEPLGFAQLLDRDRAAEGG